MTKRIFNLIIAMIFMATTAFAGNTPSISTLGSKSLIVDTKEWKSDFIQIEIRDAEGTILFNDKYSTQNGKKLSFEDFPAGKYAIILSDNLKSTTQYFVIDNDGVNIEKDIQTTYMPVVTISGDYIDLNYLTFDKNTSVTVYDENDSIFTIDFKNENNINKRFDTTDLPKGTYYFSVSSTNTSFSKTFTK